jgi:hypothetical protein
LKVFWNLDFAGGIILPERILFEIIPGWDELRAVARFILIANLSFAILASFAVYGLIKDRFSSFKQQIVLVAIIGFVILFEFSMIPYPSSEQPIPDIYEEIKNDQSKFAILATPLGGTGDAKLSSNPQILYHQIYHEKPIIGGFESRVSMDVLKSTQTYFLNMFHKFASADDVIKQDLTTHGLSLFDHFDIKYLTVHKDAAKGTRKVMEIQQIMSEILIEDRPIYEDKNIIVYKIPKPTSSEPFLLLGSGWHMFESQFDARATMKNSEILIVNPTNSEINVTLNLILSSIKNENIMTVSMNGEKLATYDISTELDDIQIENLILKPGINVVTLDADKYIEEKITFPFGTIAQMSFKVDSVSIKN